MFNHVIDIFLYEHALGVVDNAHFYRIFCDGVLGIEDFRIGEISEGQLDWGNRNTSVGFGPGRRPGVLKQDLVGAQSGYLFAKLFLCLGGRIHK